MSTETPTGAVAVRDPKDLLAYLTKSKGAIEMALPKHLSADRMCRLALTAFSTNESLRQCSPRSILASVVVASQLGLEPGVAGQGYLIPYKGQCTFVPGWQGLVSLLNNTGRATAWTGAVYDGDHWSFQLGSSPRCDHIPGPNYGDLAFLRWVYACGKVNGSEQPVIEAWPMSRVWKHRDRYNKVGQKHYSYANEEMYARKVVLLQVLKYMPRSIELNNAITAADAAELGQIARVVDSVVIIDPEPTDIPQAKPVFEEPNPTFVISTAGLAAAAAEHFKPAAINPASIVAETVKESAAAAGLPTEPEPKKSVRAKAEPVQLPPSAKDRFIEAGVSFDDFTDWCVTTGREPKAKEWYAAAMKEQEEDNGALTPFGLYSHVPDQFWKALEMDAIGVGKAITLYGKK